MIAWLTKFALTRGLEYQVERGLFLMRAGDGTGFDDETFTALCNAIRAAGDEYEIETCCNLRITKRASWLMVDEMKGDSDA